MDDVIVRALQAGGIFCQDITEKTSVLMPNCTYSTSGSDV